MHDKIDFFSLEKEASYQYGRLRNVIEEAQSILKIKNRTDKQLNNVLHLINEVMDEYIESEKDKEINRLRISILKNIHKDNHGIDFDGLYPFQWVYMGDGTPYLEFVGDNGDIDCCDFNKTDEVELLYKILDELKRYESNDYFLNSEPREYFAALALHYVYFVADRYDSFNGSVSLTSLDSTIIACNALSVGNMLHETGKYIKINNGIAEVNKKLKEKEEQNIKMLKKANDSKHKKNREARKLVCDDWANKQNDFKSAIDAARHYQPWLLKLGYCYNDTTIRQWILSHAKYLGIK